MASCSLPERLRACRSGFERAKRFRGAANQRKSSIYLSIHISHDLLTCHLIQASPTGASAPSGFEQHSSSSYFDQQLRSAISMRSECSAPGLEIDAEMELKRPPEASRRHLGGTSKEPGVLESQVQRLWGRLGALWSVSGRLLGALGQRPRPPRSTDGASRGPFGERFRAPRRRRERKGATGWICTTLRTKTCFFHSRGLENELRSSVGTPGRACRSGFERVRAPSSVRSGSEVSRPSGNQPGIGSDQSEKSIEVASHGLDLLDPLPRRLIHPACSGSDRKVDMISTA